MKKFFLGFVTALAFLGVLSAENVVYLSFDPLTETASTANASYNSGYSAGYNAGYDSGYDEGCSRAGTPRQAYAPPSDSEALYPLPAPYETPYSSGYSPISSVEDSYTPAPAPQTNVVYVTRTGKKYHRYGCQYLKDSCIEKSLSDAIAQGYTACSKCG